MIDVVDSACAAERLNAASDFLTSIAAGTEVVLVGSSRGAVDDLVRALSASRTATFGWHRFTLTQLAARLAAPALSARGLAPCTRLAAEAVATRAAFEALRAKRIPFFAPVARCPGFGRTFASTADELRSAGVDPDSLAALGSPADQLAELLAGYDAQLDRARLADHTLLLRTASETVGSDPLTLMPIVLLDVALDTRAERELVGALCRTAPRVLLTVVSGDERAREFLAEIGAMTRARPVAPRSSLTRLQAYLFAVEPPQAAADDSVQFFSAPGEARESVEIARSILAEAQRGTPFDEMVVFLRSPETYRALLETAFRRAGVPAYFSRGTRRPNPSGRAFLALLACAADGYSASRFAEYLSFGQVPAAGTGTVPPDGTWVGPRDDALGAAARAASDARSGESTATDGPEPSPEATVAAPWRWEALLVDAAVIGGVDRWRRRLDGLDRELALRTAELSSDEPESARHAGLVRTRANLAQLRGFALPVIERLAALPARAAWGDWLAHLNDLAPRVLRQPQAVLKVLAELSPMADVGPVDIGEVRDVLAERLTQVTDEPPANRYGRVLVATLDDARGRSLQVVFVPGLAERVFPQRPREDPLLLDPLRRRLRSRLDTQDERGQRERLLLRLAVGAAQRRIYLSYPRVDVVQARPRVASFYGLDIARAVEGRIPDVEAFQRRAEAQVGARLAWPAPLEAQRAIDASEHDLAVLARLIHPPTGEPAPGAARYLLDLNPHLARSLRTRYGRWERKRWSEYDGISNAPAIIALLAKQRLTERPYSPSALQQYAACPYRFFLASIQRLAPRAEAVALEQLDPLTRGKLVHRVQAETLRSLTDAGRLPLTVANVGAAESVLFERLTAIGAEFYDQLAPPILRVWQDELTALHADLVYWLRHLAERGDAWQPAYFELGFGIESADGLDPNSRKEAVVLANGMQLRGSADLVERRSDGRALRVTDHKTGADRTTAGLVVGQGEVLQPVLYGLAIEAALGQPVIEGRLFHCTSRGGFTEHIVVLDERNRRAGLATLETIDAAISIGFLPPAPREEACEHCDFRLVCGPYEKDRWREKEQAQLAELLALRDRP